MNSLGILRISVIHPLIDSTVFFFFPLLFPLRLVVFSAALTYMLPATLSQHILSLRTIIPPSIP